MVISDDSSACYIMWYFKVVSNPVTLLTRLRMADLGVLLIWENMCSQFQELSGIVCAKKQGNLLYDVYIFFICSCEYFAKSYTVCTCNCMCICWHYFTTVIDPTLCVGSWLFSFGKQLWFQNLSKYNVYIANSITPVSLLYIMFFDNDNVCYTIDNWYMLCTAQRVLYKYIYIYIVRYIFI